MILGICGPACSGKNIVSDIFKQHGFLISDADEIGRLALVYKKKELLAVFGDQILNKDHSINRKALGTIVFSDPKLLKKLNAITHPFIEEQMRLFIQNHPGQNLALNAPLLPYVKIPEIEGIIWVTAGFFKRLIRSLKRDQRGLQFSLKRMWAQRHLSPKLFFKKVDTYTIRNNGDFSALQRHVEDILTRISCK
ncbi:MAG: dephospho-CoA kinase [Spirochaetia bacterium]